MGEAVDQVWVELELALQQPAVRASRERLDALLCDEFGEIAASGLLFGKEEVLRRLPQETGVVFEATDFDVRAIAPDVALVVYCATRRSGGTQAHSMRSSLWRREAGGWRMVFHQGSPLPAADNIGPPQDAPVPALPA